MGRQETWIVSSTSATAFANSLRKRPTGEVFCERAPRTAYGVIARRRPKVLVRCIPYHPLITEGVRSTAQGSPRTARATAWGSGHRPRSLCCRGRADPHAPPWFVLLLHFKPHPIGQPDWTEIDLKAFIGKLGLRRSAGDITD